MKKELLKILDSEDATFRLNNISYLHRWTKDALGNDVDRLELEFDHINGTCFSCMMLLEANTTYFLSFSVSWFNTFRYCDF